MFRIVLRLLVIVPFVAASAVAAEGRPPHVFFMIGEGEYDTKTTLPAFAKAELEPRGLRCSFSILPAEEDEVFPAFEALKDADLLLISVRRHAPPKAQMDLIRAHVAAGKPVVGIRTASHAFGKRRGETEGVWEKFDAEVLGGTYDNHYGKDVVTFARVVPEAAGHPVLTGIAPEEFRVPSHLYKYPVLAASVTRLMTARMEGRPEVEPVAWVNTAHDRRVFYTSLGSAEDFAVPQFRRLLLNGIHWALGLPVPTESPPKKTEPAPPAAALPLSPAEAARSFEVAGDLEIEQLLAEPLVEQPVFLNFDERGRMWVVEYRQYPEPAGLKLLSHDSVWRAVYDKIPAPPPHHVRGLDRISIHEDTDGDGTFDKHTIFVEGLNICTAVERGRGGVWVLNPPYLLFYPDRNNDDVPDGDPVVHLAGFGLEDTHSVANSLRWGADGWLYGAHGSTVTSSITVLGREPVTRIVGQGIWRYHPGTGRFEVFAEGGGNTFGVEMDAKGRIFSGHNGGDTRGFHYQQGAYLRKGFDKHGPLSNPYTFGYFEPMPHAKVERFTHNFVIYEGGALPALRAGHLFGVEPLQGRIVESEVTPDGASFRTRDLDRPVTSRDRWFRPVDIKAGPDGALYVCDWYEAQIAHWKNYRDQTGASNGRIYRIKAQGSRALPPRDFGSLPSAELLPLLDGPNKWTRQTVQRLLADRRNTSLVPLLVKSLAAADGQYALELLWALQGSGGLDEAAARHCLDHRDPFVRHWTARLLCDEGQVTPAIARQLASLAEHESNLEVRAQLACSARRLPASEDFAILRGLLTHDEDAADARLPLLLWWALEAKTESDRDAVLAFFRESRLWDLPLVKSALLERLLRRYAQPDTRKDLLTCAALFDLAPTPEHSRRLMTGFEAAFKGRALAGLPDELVQAMRRHHVSSPALALRLGDPSAVESALKSLADERAPAAQRIEAATIFGEVKTPGSVPVLLRVMEETANDALRKTALTALAQFDNPEIAGRVLAFHPRFAVDVRPFAQNLLASRPAWAAQFLAAVEAGTIAPAAVAPEIVRRLRLHAGDQLPARVEKIWGRSGIAGSAEFERQLERLRPLVHEPGGDPYQGRVLFAATCAGCHSLHGLGGQIGPDLTKLKRDDLDTLLVAIVNPNAEIREGYENVFVTMNDGRVINGFLVEQDPQVVVLRGLDGQNATLERAQIAELKSAGVSLMPEGLLTAFADQQIRDLFAYLRTSQPLVGKAEGR
ncbi:MAG: hypothetical protein QOE70_1184 [Chthoniobacter sp.]|jgi:putative heme-binding domain-containing protein|nr:hypothetical protein [Chthoniobacter sp.]